MNPNPKISILLATYNRSHYISQAIWSVINQTYQNWELLIWNDGSKDDTEEIIQEFCDNRIHYFKTETNRGKTIGLNFLLLSAIGEFICFLDDDDQYTNDYLQTIIDIYDHHPEIDFLFSDFTNRDLVRNNETVGTISKSSGFRHLNVTLIDDEVYKITGGLLEGLITGNFIQTDTVMLRRSVIEEVGPFNEQLKSSEDLEYWWRVAIHKKTFAFTTRNLLTRNWLQDGLCRPSISSFENQIRCLDVFMNSLTAANRRDLSPKVKKAYRYPYNMLIRQYALLGNRRKATHTFFQSFKYGIDFRAIYLLIGAFIGPSISRRLIKGNF